ncbi:hypothetical protein [Vibrio sp. B1-2]|uniref:hypothetical protein n=1 Tax=Vibrio sp. B1-2 TaxID=2591465 RepID=UPI001482185B|nr:hypothetical protein [Vibrio sp. B1-2]
MYFEILKIAAQILISIGAAFLAARLATSRYRSEKVWDQKMLAYSELIESLHRMKWPISEHLTASLEGRELSDEASDEQWADYRAARKDVSKVAEKSSFIVSHEVVDVIADLESGRSKARTSQHWIEHLEIEWNAVDECIDKVKKIGNQDLKVKNA